MQLREGTAETPRSRPSLRSPRCSTETGVAAGRPERIRSTRDQGSAAPPLNLMGKRYDRNYVLVNFQPHPKRYRQSGSIIARFLATNVISLEGTPHIMRIRRVLAASSAVVIAATSLAACSSGDSDGKIVVGTTDAAKKAWSAFEDEAEAQGLDIEVQNFSDYNTPNQALDQGELDTNNFQHT